MLQDPWWPIRPLILAFNDRMKKVLVPGAQVCIDECMSAWRGLDSSIAGRKGLPHVTKIKRKPEGIGCEMKSIADVDTGMIFKLDLMEGKLRESLKMYHDKGAGTARAKRLTAVYNYVLH